MLVKIQYYTQEDRQRILDENTTNYLVEEANIIDGNFLIFTDIKPIEQEFIELKDENKQLTATIMAQADRMEQTESDNVDFMDYVTETLETLKGGI